MTGGIGTVLSSLTIDLSVTTSQTMFCKCSGKWELRESLYTNNSDNVTIELASK